MNIESYQSEFDALLSGDMYHLEQKRKETLLCQIFSHLHELHRSHCFAYRNLFETHDVPFSSYNNLPMLAVRLFKLLTLSSITDDEIFRVLTSSGTTAQVPARIVLDKATSARQSKVLVKIVQSFAGKQRLPMLIIDSPDVIKPGALSARAAGIQGMMFFGRDHTFALNSDLSLNVDAVQQFSEKYKGQTVIVFGFTFLVYLSFLRELSEQGITVSLPNAILFHSGGWKKMQEHAVSNVRFKEQLLAQCGICRVHNFYGMAEQVGSVFMECERGVLHAPSVADVVIRDVFTLDEVEVGQKGLIQVLSTLPTSYPGYSILTEDMGRLLGEDDCACGRKGRYFEVLGRLPKTEVRGCSDIAGGAL